MKRDVLSKGVSLCIAAPSGLDRMIEEVIPFENHELEQVLLTSSLLLEEDIAPSQAV